MKDLQFSINIHASNQRVWDTLWKDETFRDWAGIIDAETYMVGDLKPGNEIQFISAANGYGVASLVEQVVEGELLLLRHSADTQETGKREREHEWTGGEERYELAEKNGVTSLTVTFGVPANLEAYFVLNYPKALERVKELAEEPSSSALNL